MARGADFVDVHEWTVNAGTKAAQEISGPSVSLRMRLPLRTGSTSGTLTTVGGMVPRRTKGK